MIGQSAAALRHDIDLTRAQVTDLQATVTRLLHMVDRLITLAGKEEPAVQEQRPPIRLVATR